MPPPRVKKAADEPAFRFRVGPTVYAVPHKRHIPLSIRTEILVQSGGLTLASALQAMQYGDPELGLSVLIFAARRCAGDGVSYAQVVEQVEQIGRDLGDDDVLDVEILGREDDVDPPSDASS